MTPDEREAQVRARMMRSGMSRESAELAVAIAAGEIDGDVIVVPEPPSPSESAQ